MLTQTADLAHSDTGVGSPALLFLPGWCGGRDVFDPLLVQTATRRRSLSADWRGHGASPAADADFGLADSVSDVLVLIERIGLERVVPVGLSHAGWVALEVRRALGPDRVPGVVLMDWMPLGPPPGFLGALAALQDPATWSDVRAQLFGMWRAGVELPAVHSYIDSMAAYGFDMWARAGREIASSFGEHNTPLAALTALADAQGTPCPTLHVYAQPHNDDYLAAQRAIAAELGWFQVHRLTATSHFPCLEAPDECAAALEAFVAELA